MKVLHLRRVASALLGKGALLVSVGIVVSGCVAGMSESGPALRAGPIAWTEGKPGSADVLCPGFDAVAAGDDGWWLAGPGCLIRAAGESAQGAIYPIDSNGWSFDRVDGVISDGNGGAWVSGRQRATDSVRAVLGRLVGGQPAIGDPGEFEMSGAVINALAAPEDGMPWAVGRNLGGGHEFLVSRWDGSRWQALDTKGLGSGELLDIDFASDGCAWMVGRDTEGGAVLLRYDGRRLRREVLDPEDGMPTRVAAGSCGDVWIAGTSVVRYAHGHREEIGFGLAELGGIALCPDGDLLVVGERDAAEPEMAGRHVGFSFRVREGEARSLPIAMPFVVADWRLADVGCDASGAWAVGAAMVRETVAGAAEKRALLLRLAASGWNYVGWEPQ